MRRISIAGALAIGLAVIMAGCDSGKSLESKIENYVPDDADIVVTVNLEKMLAVTGSSVDKDGALDPGRAVNDLMGLMGEYERENFESLISNPYVEWTNAVIAAKIVGRNTDMLAVLSVSDEEGFIKHLANDTGGELTDVDGRKFVTWDDMSMTACDGMAFVALRHSHGCKPQVLLREIDNWKDEAIKKPLQPWKLERLAADKLLNVYANLGFVAEGTSALNDFKNFAGLDNILNNCVVINADILDKKLTMSCDFVDRHGKTLNVAPGAAKIDPSMLKYANAGQPVVFAMTGFKNIPRPEGNEVVEKWLNDMRGTVLVAFGPTPDMLQQNSFGSGSIFKGNLTFVMRFASEKVAAEALETVLSQANDNVQEYVVGQRIVLRVNAGYTTNKNADYWEDDYYIPTFVNIYYKRYGDVLVVSTTDKTGGCPVKPSQLQGSAAIAVSLPAGGSVMKMLNQDFGLEAKCSADGTGIKAECEVTDTDEDFIATLMGMIGSLNKK